MADQFTTTKTFGAGKETESSETTPENTEEKSSTTASEPAETSQEPTPGE